MKTFEIFNKINFQQIEIILVFVIAILVVLSIVLIWKSINRMSKKIDLVSSNLREEIKFSIQPKFIEMSLNVESLVELAVEVWRIEQRITKVSSSLPEVQRKGVETSIQKLKRYLEKYDIEIKDYTNQKFNDGLNLDVLSVEKDTSVTESVVKETIEPTILCKGQVVKKAKIILLSN